MSRTLLEGESEPKAEAQAAPQPLAIVDPARFEVRGEHARGGQGRVLEAWDRRLERKVAIKELLRASPEAEARFQREARLTARLQHPGVVPILEAGRWPSGEALYVMKLVEGRAFSELLAETGTLDDRLALLPVVLAVADTLAYAHSRRIVHRDVKPENVLVGPFGESLLVDWGLGRDLADASEAPQAGGGTPGYMPPEQAAGRPVDERADVYATGALLYRLLAGVEPSAAEPADAVRLEAREPGIPVDLLAIVRTATAREPERRYPSARELSEDLRRFQRGQLVGAHRYSRWQLAARWARRHRSALTVAAVLLSALAATATLSVRRIVREKARAEAERARAETERKSAVEKTNALILSQAESWLDHDPTASLAWLRRYPLDGAEPARAHAIALEAEARGVARHVLAHHRNAVTALAFSADGQRAVSTGADGLVLGWSTRDGKLESAQLRPGGLRLLRLLPDGRLVTVDSDGQLALGPLEGPPRPLAGHRGPVTAIDLSPDGRWLASAGEDQTVRWWDLAAGTAQVLSGHTSRVSAVAFAPDGRSLASTGPDKTVRLWTRDAAGRITASVVGVQAAAGAQLAFHPDGRRLASAGLDGKVWLWQLGAGGARAAGRVLETHVGQVLDLAFSPDGRWLASAGSDRTVRLTDLASGAVRTLTGAGDDVNAVRFYPDSRALAAAASDDTVRVWDPESGEGVTLLGHRAAVLGVQPSPDGKLLASISRDGTIRLWPAPLRGRVLRGHRDAVFDVLFSPDGARLASSSLDRTVRLWEPTSARVLTGHEDVVTKLRFSLDGAQLLSMSLDDTVRAWDLGSGRGRPITSGPLRLFDLAFFAPGALVGRGPGAALTVVELAAGTTRELTGPSQQVLSLALAPDGRRVAGASKDGSVWLWDLPGGAGRKLGAHGGVANMVAWSPDGRWLASAGGDHRVQLFSPDTGEGPRVLTGHTDGVYLLDFSADGRRLASADTGNTIRVWDLASGRARPLVGHRESIRRLRFCGDRLASVSWDGTVRLWDPDSGASRIAHRHSGYVKTLAVSPDGKRLASGGADATVWLGEVDDGPLLPVEPAALAAALADLSTAEIGAGERPMSHPDEAR